MCSSLKVDFMFNYNAQIYVGNVRADKSLNVKTHQPYYNHQTLGKDNLKLFPANLYLRYPSRFNLLFHESYVLQNQTTNIAYANVNHYERI